MGRIHAEGVVKTDGIISDAAGNFFFFKSNGSRRDDMIKHRAIRIGSSLF